MVLGSIQIDTHHWPMTLWNTHWLRTQLTLADLATRFDNAMKAMILDAYETCHTSSVGGILFVALRQTKT